MHFGYNCLMLLNSIYRQAPGNRKGVCSAELGPSQKPKGSMQRWISMPVRDFLYSNVFMFNPIYVVCL